MDAEKDQFTIQDMADLVRISDGEAELRDTAKLLYGYDAEPRKGTTQGKVGAVWDIILRHTPLYSGNGDADGIKKVDGILLDREKESEERARALMRI